jgi:signal transduction histidine kinase
VTATVGRDAGGAKITIGDTGPGISDRDLPHIFDRFYRAERKRGPAGFGLGLTIAKAIAEAHGGRIEVSTRVGKGTAFTVHLPSSH